ncbi:MAG: hypothetical protein Q4D14_04725 [Bacteroidales bacterium]|nr:hypothetical protein [Bacteroidales bacterium]
MNKPKTDLQHIMAYALIAVGLVLLFVALMLPPEGEIHPTALTAFGEILTFAGTVLGMDYHYRNKR